MAAFQAVYQGVNADDPAVDIAERPTAIPWIDGCVRLNVVLVFIRQQIIPALGADDTGGERVGKFVWRADRADQLANFNLIAVSKFNGW